MSAPAGEGGLTLAAVKRASRWLSEFSSNVTSQAGEDGVLAKALTLLPDRNLWCVEFGAWDGRQYSNTYNLVEGSGYQVVLIEGDPKKYQELRSAYPYPDRAVFIQGYVGWSAEDSLDVLLDGRAIPSNPDLVSIDVDGNDYHIWRAMERTQPKLLLIEYNPTMANSVEFVQAAEACRNQGSSPASLVKLGQEKGYELIAATRLNLLFVERQYFGRFHIADNTLEALRDDPPDHIFCGYDGTVFVAGAVGARWHQLWLEPEAVQVLPRFLRKYPSYYSWFERQALAVVRRWRGGSSRERESNSVAEQRRRWEQRPK